MNNKHQLLNIYCDGGSRGNPGPAAIGVVIYNQQQKKLAAFAKKIGITTNNQAEYQAVIEAYKYILAKNFQVHKMAFFLDSQIVVRQLAGIYKVKDKELKELFYQIKDFEWQIKALISYQHVSRENNWLADQLLNKLLDRRPTFSSAAFSSPIVYSCLFRGVL